MKIWDGYSPFGHPLQYAFCGSALVLDTQDATDEQIRALPEVDTGLLLERFNRCPTCEQWSPCDARKEAKS